MQTNKYISLESAENLIAGAGYAAQIDIPLNRWLTISWWVSETPGRTLDAQREVLQLASKWLRYHGVTPAYVWAIEDGPVLHHHSHVLIHVPDHLKRRFRVMVNRWVKSVGGDPRHKGAVRWEPVTQRATYYQSLKHLIKYLLKGIELDTAQLIGIPPRYEKAGFITSKRCGTSQNLGPAARAKALN